MDQKSLWSKSLGGENVWGPKCPGAEMSRGRYVWGSKCPGTETSLGRNVRVPKRPWGRNIQVPKCPGAETSLGPKGSYAEMSLVLKHSGRNILCWNSWGRNLMKPPKYPDTRSSLKTSKHPNIQWELTHTRVAKTSSHQDQELLFSRHPNILWEFTHTRVAKTSSP